MPTWSWTLANVDPFVIPVPPKLLEDPELRPFFEYLNRFLHDLFVRSGGGEDLVENSQVFNKKTLAGIININQKIGSGDFLTSDETGFTVDSDKLSVDMDEA